MTRRTHGMSRTPTYAIWAGMVARCHRPTLDEAHSHYVRRGITVCERWRTSFVDFLADMGERPEGMTIERKDNDLGYTPENCVWATQKEQQRNRRKTVFLTIDGVRRSLAEWCELAGVASSTVVSRMEAGQSAKDAVFLPADHIARGPKPVSGLRGVVPSGDKWGARVCIGSKSVWLGTFDTPQEAHQAVLNAKLARQLEKSNGI